MNKIIAKELFCSKIFTSIRLYIDLVDGNFIWRSSILDSKKVFLLSLSTKRIISSTPFPDHTSFFIVFFPFFFFFFEINAEEVVYFSFKRN